MSSNSNRVLSIDHLLSVVILGRVRATSFAFAFLGYPRTGTRYLPLSLDKPLYCECLRQADTDCSGNMQCLFDCKGQIYAPRSSLPDPEVPLFLLCLCKDLILDDLSTAVTAMLLIQRQCFISCFICLLREVSDSVQGHSSQISHLTNLVTMADTVATD